MDQVKQPDDNNDNTAMLIAVQQQLIQTQQDLLKAQKQIISLQKQLNKQTPKNPRDKDIFWHLASDGLLSTEAANSGDLITLKQFYEWNVNFAKKYIRPYVNPKVYGECLNQMTRGLAARISALETQAELGLRGNGHSRNGNSTSVR
ncbi:MAG: hypothetical protein ABI947_30310 [Chloroflexota bacterium]